MFLTKKVFNAVLTSVLIAMLVATPTSANADNFSSDDFNPCGPLNVWTPTTPVAGQTISDNGTQLVIDIPSGDTQTIWADNSPIQYNVARLMQPFNGDGLADDFEIEVKFDSRVDQEYEQQGVVIEQDASNVLRFELFYDNTDKIVAYYGRFITENGVGMKKVKGALSLVRQMALRPSSSESIAQPDSGP